MKKLVTLLLAVAVFALATPAFASQCPLLLKKVDARLSSAQVSREVLEKVKQLRAQGEADHKAGKHDASVAALKEALKLLGS